MSGRKTIPITMLVLVLILSLSWNATSGALAVCRLVSFVSIVVYLIVVLIVLLAGALRTAAFGVRAGSKTAPGAPVDLWDRELDG